ncbi:MAG: carboxypeptidase regulatory-like domain-containing protein [Acidobacteriota bacterium]|nr:carboxypeptidase regulatory-like domain-containing protein [Acidobacteriota bacterium]
MFDSIKRFGIIACLSLGLAFLMAMPVDVHAQAATGGIRGAVTDVTGAALPGATVTAKNPATGLESKTTTNSEGYFSIPRMQPGKYTLVVEAQGFKKAETTDIEVSVGKDAVVDSKLETGAITEVVTVAGGAEALVEKDSVQISTTFEQKKIQDLPINAPGRGLDRVALLTPGVTVGFGNVNGNGVTLSANGQRARSNNFTIDGVDNNDLSIGGPNYFVRNPEVVGEFQVVTNNFSAEYGRNQGAIVNVVSRSGGNQYHGSVGWDHLDNKNFNSLSNIERRSGQLNPAPDLDNIFTYGVGGPIVKNKIFFYTTGYFRRNPRVADLRTTAQAPTPAGIQALKAAFPNNAALQYYADFSAFNLPIGNPTARTDVAGQTLTLGTVNIPMAAVRRLVPLTNRQDEYTFRGDANLTEKHRLWGRYFWQDTPNINSLADVRGWAGDSPAQSKQIGGGWTWTLTTRLVNEVRFNYSKLFVLFGGGNAGGKGQIPHPDEIDKAFAFLNPTFTVGGFGLLTIGPATNLPQGRSVEAYQVTDNLTWTRGNHQMKMGFDYRKLQNTAPFLPNVNGNFQFDSVQQLIDNKPTQITVAFGPATLSYGEHDQFYYFQDDWRIKPNLTLNLGIRYENTGQPINLLNDVTVLRESIPTEAFWRQSLPIDARTNNRIPVDNNNWAPRLGFVYSPKFDSGLMGKLFGSDKTTVRGGYGIAYDATFYNLMLNISTAAPTVFLTSAPQFGVPNATPTGDVVRASAASSGLIRFNTFDPRFLSRTTINPVMRSPYSQQWSFGIQREIKSNVVEVRYVGNHSVGLFQTINANPFIGNLVNGFSRTYHDPVANTARTLNLPGFPNAIPSGIRPQTCTDNAATLDNEGVCNGRVFPFGVARERINGAQSTYHGLQTRFDGRFKRDFIYGFTYTWSKALDNASEVFNFAGGNSVAVSQNPLNLTSGEKSYSGFDVPHSFTMNLIYELPFMRDQRGILGRAVGGWQVNATARVQNGVRFTPTHPSPARNPYEDVTFMSTFFGNSQMRPFAGNPNAAAGSVAITDVDACIFYARCGTTSGNPNLRTSSTGFYLMSDLNRNVFTAVSPNDVRYIVNGPGAAMKFNNPFGTVARNSARGDRIETVDFSLFKTFKVWESVNIQYQLTLINALNHPVFGTPNTNVDNVNFFNFQENDGGRRTISMGLRVRF